MDFENSLTYQFTQLATAYRNNLQKAVNEINLHSGQIFLLISLWKVDGQSQIDLANNLYLTPPTINKMVKGLVENGFAVTKKGENDGRIMRVYLTDKGRRCKSSAEEIWLRHETESFSNLTDTEKLMLLHLFEKLRENTDKKIAPEPTNL